MSDLVAQLRSPQQPNDEYIDAPRNERPHGLFTREEAASEIERLLAIEQRAKTVLAQGYDGLAVSRKAQACLRFILDPTAATREVENG